ncbi:hypothetical protein AHAS_Ahas15G0275300 [Arachis hypogaea]
MDECEYEHEDNIFYDEKYFGDESYLDGRAPSSLITDGARTMKNAIEEVFPGTHHRLCAWHLLRNAMTNMCSLHFTSKFKDCMLGDYEIPVFRKKWQTLVEEFGIEEKEWLNEIYEKRRSWATCYIRGKFFAGFRTTSLGSILSLIMTYSSLLSTSNECWAICGLGNFTLNVNLLVEFQLCKLVLNPLRYVLLILTQGMYAKPTNVWEVEWVDNGNAITCSCMRMESFGIFYEHIISVLVRKDVWKIPKCLVLHRWTKKAKKSMSDSSSFTSELQASSQLSILNECARMMSEVTCATTDRFHEARDLMLDLYSSYKALDGGNTPSKPGLRGGTNPKGHSGRKKSQHCNNCKKPGHNKIFCSKHNENTFGTQGSSTR